MQDPDMDTSDDTTSNIGEGSDLPGEVEPTVRENEPPSDALRWDEVRTLSASGDEVMVRRVGVVGGWIYQVSDRHDGWSAPVFVPLPLVATDDLRKADAPKVRLRAKSKTKKRRR